MNKHNMKQLIMIAIFSLVLAGAEAQVQTPAKQNDKGHHRDGHRTHRHNNLSRVFSAHKRHHQNNGNNNENNIVHGDRHNNRQNKH
jgi:hypothetical protein